MKKYWMIVLLTVLLFPATAALGGGVYVYDNNGDLLGFFVGHSDNNFINVYNQSLGVNLVIRTNDSSSLLGHFQRFPVYFTVDSCDGTAYLHDDAHYNSLVEGYDDTLYYTRADIQNLTAEAVVDETGSCDTTISVGIRLRLATEVTTGELPFTYPIVFPLEYRFQNTAVVVPLP